MPRRLAPIFGIPVVLLLLTSAAYADACTVAVTSNPAGAEVYVNGEYIGDTAEGEFVSRYFGYSTSVEVLVKKEGYGEWERSVKIPFGQTLEVVASLEPVEKAEPPSPEAKPPSAEEDKKSGQKPRGAVCGPGLLLALAMLPLGIRRILHS